MAAPISPVVTGSPAVSETWETLRGGGAGWPEAQSSGLGFSSVKWSNNLLPVSSSCWEDHEIVKEEVFWKLTCASLKTLVKSL